MQTQFRGLIVDLRRTLTTRDHKFLGLGRTGHDVVIPAPRLNTADFDIGNCTRGIEQTDQGQVIVTTAKMVTGHRIDRHWQCAHHPVRLINKMHRVIADHAAVATGAFKAMKPRRDIAQLAQGAAFDLPFHAPGQWMGAEVKANLDDLPTAQSRQALRLGQGRGHGFLDEQMFAGL